MFLIILLSEGVKLSSQEVPELKAEGFDSHVELTWKEVPGVSVSSYHVFRSENGSTYTQIKSTTSLSYIDFTGFQGYGISKNYTYKVVALNSAQSEIAVSKVVTATVKEMSDDALLDMVQRYTFRYFWDFAHPVSGLARERNASGETVTIGGSGFGVMAILVGIKRGFITREQGLNRLLQIVGFLQYADKFHGVFPHWMNGTTGKVIPFSQYDNGGDLVETAFLIQGLLAARQFFNQNNDYENALRIAITSIWEKVEWSHYSRNNSGVLYWHWSPNYGWQMNHQIRGFNETHIVYILGIAAPKFPVPASYYNSGWAKYNYYSGLIWYGYQLATGPPRGGPLFFAHYSYLGFDPRNKRDFYANYFIRNKHHTLINRAYCIENPLGHPGYSNVSWGLTASDNPWGYLAHEPSSTRDNGTISPTAALSSMPYTPAESMAALKHFYRNLGHRLWGPMGFYDAFNLKVNWFANSYLAIDQGPIICMIENYRSGLLWDMFMANPEIKPALDAIGFKEDLSNSHEPFGMTGFEVFPNPVNDYINIEFNLRRNQLVSIDILDLNGRESCQILKQNLQPKGLLSKRIELSGLNPGLYFIRTRTETGVQVKKFVKQ